MNAELVHIPETAPPDMSEENFPNLPRISKKPETQKANTSGSQPHPAAKPKASVWETEDTMKRAKNPVPVPRRKRRTQLEQHNAEQQNTKQRSMQDKEAVASHDSRRDARQQITPFDGSTLVMQIISFVIAALKAVVASLPNARDIPEVKQGLALEPKLLRHNTASLHEGHTSEEFAQEIANNLKATSKQINVPKSYTSIDIEYERLRAIRHCAERKYRRNGDINCWIEAKATKAKIKRHLKKLSIKSWTDTCNNLSPTTTANKMWTIVKSLKCVPSQTAPFRTISLKTNSTEKEIANSFLAALNKTSEASISALYHQSLRSTIVDNSMQGKAAPKELEMDFTVHELKRAIQAASNKKTAPGPDGISYKCLANIGRKAMKILLEIYNKSWRTGRMENGTPDCITDLVTAVQHNKALSIVTVAVFLDIKSAFDSVSHAHVLQAARKSGLNGKTFAWLTSFLTDRKVFMDTNEGSTPPVTLVQGVPQGAVLSPTLFNLLMSELASLLPHKVKYTMYADDLCIWSSGRQIQAIENTLQYALVTIAIFLEERAMDLSTSKTVYLPFTGKRLKNFKLTVAGTEIRRVTKHKYLGVTTNRNTTWGDQVKHLRKSTRTYTNIMKILGGYRWGNNKALQAIHRGLIRQTIAYSIPCLQNLSPSQDNRLQRILSRSLRICLGLPRTVRTDIVLAEGREPPIQTLRKQETERHLIRLLTRHYGHPFIDKIKQRTKCSIYKAIRYIDRILPKHRAKRHYQDTAPWLLLPPKISTEVPGIDKKNETPQVALKALAMAHIEENYPVAMQVYTDGSTSKNRSSSAFVTDGITKAYRLSHKTTSTAAEQHAILKALRHIRKSQAGTWVVCSDSRAALYSIQKQDPQDRTVYNIMKAHSEAEALGHNISLQWIPSHCDISGNECADRAAKEALSKIQVSLRQMRPDADGRGMTLLPRNEALLKERSGCITRNQYFEILCLDTGVLQVYYCYVRENDDHALIRNSEVNK
ncbi:uncharacterized protein LOC135400523 [Ornithodoros turicata]|uniref:uncharacterized protein LOC135400523 n=1 Tax=Ornithodoros turicata TaxID=34597 RepID=UPI003138923F